MELNTALYGISLLIAILVIILGIYAGIYSSLPIRILPKALRLHLIYCYYVFVIFHAFLTIAICIAFFTTNSNQTDSLVTNLRLIIVFPCQFLRNYFFTVVLERILATILLEKYSISYKSSLFIILMVFSQIITVVFAIFFYYANFIAIPGSLMSQSFSYGIFIFHFITILTFFGMYFFNKRMYKVTAYRITLKRRHQIAENIKVLAFLYTPILIFTFLAPLGPLLTIIGYLTNLFTTPYCILHIFYNLPQIIIFLRQILKKQQKYGVSNVGETVVVKSALGKTLTVKHEADFYFNGLKQQWK